MIREFLEAIRFLTILPVPAFEAGPHSLARAMFFFPAVGFLIGAVSLGVFFLFQSFLPAPAASLVLLLAPIFITGGLHVDGFADFCDGFFGGKDKSEILRIMKDPHLGVWGTVGLVLLLLTKFELLQIMPHKTLFFLTALVSARWVQVVLSFCLPYAGSQEGLGKAVAGQVRRREFLGATIFFLPLLFGFQGKGIVILAALILFLTLSALYFKKKIGGLTGDLLGAASEMTEVLVFLLAVAWVRA